MTVVERSEIALKDLEELFNGGLTAVRVPHYYPADIATTIANVLLESRLHGKYENAPKIGRVGQAFFESQVSEQSARSYEKESVSWIREIRAAFFPYLTPIDRVRLELDEVWPAGAQLAMLNGHKMFVGLARTFAKGSFAEPHQDVFSWDAPESEDAKRVQTQLAMNVYLNMPKEGGELTLWSIALDRSGYEELRNQGSYGLQREKLPSPVVTISPRQGELILFNANKVHAVEEIHDGTRVTWSSFLGYQGDQLPIVLWS